ncbi:MAG: DUF362 domain-containing protein, partial [Verrucomicrobiota bacterium]
MAELFITNLEDDYRSVVAEGLNAIDAGSMIGSGDLVFIKPNLTFPHFREGVMTTKECVESIVIALKDYTDRIVIGEADSGGYNPFNISEVQEKTGLKALEKTYGIEVVNLSHYEKRTVQPEHGPPRSTYALPDMLLDEVAVTVSAAVPKIHMNTLVSMTVKNLWGCLPIPDLRLKCHPFLKHILFDTVQRLGKTIGIVDGRYGLNRS